MAEIDRVRAVTLGVTNVNRSREFYTNVWGLTAVAEKDGSVFLRGGGVDHHLLVLSPADRPRLVSVTFGVADCAALHALYERLVDAGVHTEKPPRELPSPGAGWGFAFRDPEGRTFKVVADRADHDDGGAESARPVKLAHVVLNSANVDETTRFFVDLLGFRLRDRTAVMSFLGCNRDHHSIALANMGNSTLNHLAFEMASWNDLMFGVGRLKEAGVPAQWGVGRHGPGDNVFAYFVDPDGFAIEYTAEVQQVDDATYQPGGPEKWVRPPNRMDQWGHSELPTSAMKSAMHGDHQTAPKE